MNGERKDILPENQFGTLTLRHYDIAGNAIDAFYDASGKLIFVLDNTINESKPNVLLVIDSIGDKKWDEILSGQYGVNLETIRPKQDNKYQKLDIEYSGLSVYDNLIDAYSNGSDLSDLLNQLDVLRDSAIRHSAMMRLSAANDVISKTNATIIRTKESIIRLQERLKTLRSTLAQQKKEIGRVSTKQSASKILKIESQIDATNEKLKRAKKRLESAQHRLETATVDAELAENILKMPPLEAKTVVVPVEQNQPVMVAPEYPVQTTESETENEEDFKDSEIKPLFDKDPEILNDDIAFKPISFDAPAFKEIDFEESAPKQPETELSEEIEFDAPTMGTTEKPVLDFITPVVEEPVVKEPIAEVPVIETPVVEMPTHFPVPDQNHDLQSQEIVVPEITENVETETPVYDNKPMEEIQMNENLVRPVSPIYQTENGSSEVAAPVVSNTVVETSRSKPTFVYYLLLLVLIILSVFTLWLYQKNMNTSSPLLVADANETVVEQKVEKPAKAPAPIIEEPEIQDDGFADVVFLDEEPVVEPEVIEEEPTVEEQITESVVETEPEIEETVVSEPEYEEPVVEEEFVEEEPAVIDETAIDKPVYEAGSRHDNMFVNEQDYVEPLDEYSYDDEFYDAEEAAYQAEQEELYYE